MQAGDVMTFGAAVVHLSAPIEEAARLMLQHRISGLPVIDDKGDLVGMVTEGDLLRRRKGGDDSDRPRWLESLLETQEARRERLAQRRIIADVMTPVVTTVSRNTPVNEIVELIQRQGIKRVPVVEGSKVIGIVSRADLLRNLARRAEEMPSASDEDLELRERVLDELAKVPNGAWRSVNVLVRNGSVELRGATTDAALRQKLVAVTRGVQGVEHVDDRLVVVGPASGRA